MNDVRLEQVIYRYGDVMAADRIDLPIAAYHVSGEYSSIMAAGAKGWLDAEKAMQEALLGIKRAGADMILTYFATVHRGPNWDFYWSMSDWPTH